MMQMLRADGIELMHDGKRAADIDNPEGYWEARLPTRATMSAVPG